MNISPISNIKFGEVFHVKDNPDISGVCSTISSDEYSEKQKAIVKEIETSLGCVVESDKNKRTYSKYLDDNGYDIFISPVLDDRIQVNVDYKPKEEGEKILRSMGMFTSLMDYNTVGTYDENNRFNIQDVMKPLNDDKKEFRKTFGTMISLVGAFVVVTIICGINKYCKPTTHEQNVIERTIKDTTAITKDSTATIKDTLQLFK